VLRCGFSLGRAAVLGDKHCRNNELVTVLRSRFMQAHLVFCTLAALLLGKTRTRSEVSDEFLLRSEFKL